MKKSRIFSSVLAVFSAALIAVSASVAVSAAKADFDAVSEPMPEQNRFSNGDMESDITLTSWEANSQSLKQIKTETGSYLECSKITYNYYGFTFTPKTVIPAGTYKFTGYVRCVYEGELTALRIIFRDGQGYLPYIWAYPTSDEWTKIETYITLRTDLADMKICGEGDERFIQAYAIDNFSLVKVDAAPSGTPANSFGTPVTAEAAAASNNGSELLFDMWDPEKEAQYEVQGLFVNQDADQFIYGLGDATKADIETYVHGFEGSHITDYVICVNNTNATFPSETWTDLPEKYNQTVENGKSVNYKNDEMISDAYKHFIVNGLDYIDIFCDTFKEIGINPWISVRMNDAHDLHLETSKLLSDYFHENPEIRRTYGAITRDSTYDYLQDYAYESVRSHMLDLVNEALNRYDCYGLELDFQREIWLWRVGGEYNGIDILNEFMRDVERLVAVYEEEYGHEIKIGVRCASDLATNYDFGLDIVNWAKEGIVDMVVPTARWTTTDNDIPVYHWVSVMHPYGVEVNPCIEINLEPSGCYPGPTNIETRAAAAASILSQGADHVYLYNSYLNISETITEADKIGYADSTAVLNTPKSYWRGITTLGSLDKLMTVNRRMIVTYNDTRQLWKNYYNDQLPINVTSESPAILKIPFGYVPEGAVVTLKLGVVNAEIYLDLLPTVIINSVPAVYSGIQNCDGGFTSEKLLCFDAAASTHGDMYVTAQISTEESLRVVYAEVYVTAPENAEIPYIAETAPSSWAATEVEAAIGADIVPTIIKRNYTDNITRSEFCTLIMTMLNKIGGVSDSRALLTKLGIDYIDSFTDTDSTDVIAANLLGIVNGRGNGIFDPLAGITRQEAATMLAKTAKALGVKNGAAPVFADIGKAGSWAHESIDSIASIVSNSGKNVMGGVGGGNFDPLGDYTREQSVLTVYRLYDSITSGAKIEALSAATSIPAIDPAVPSPAKVKPTGVQGVLVRADASNVNLDRINGNGITDMVLTLGSADASSLIQSLKAMGIKVYISVDSENAAELAKAALNKYNVDGIEVDFLGRSVNEIAAGNTYNALDENTEMLEALNGILPAYEAKYGHSIFVSARVASDVMNSYHLGMNVTEWAHKGFVDIVSPSPDTVSDTDMHTRLWYSLLEGYGVALVPTIGENNKLISYGSTFWHKSETVASEAAVMLSQGADKVAIDYITANDVGFGILSTIGSYSNAVSAHRRAVPTYSDTNVPWIASDNQIPKSIGAGGIGTVKIPIGDVPAGKTVKLRLLFDSYLQFNKNTFLVFANSDECTYSTSTVDRSIGGFLNPLPIYTVPVSAVDDGHLVLELVNNGSEAVTIGYLDVCIE